jgi:lipopolysaccharide/colanic/teichoic acid biosynthesis glycosyltransferase
MRRFEFGLWQRIVILLALSDLLAVGAGLTLARELRYLTVSLDLMISPRPSVPGPFLIALGALWVGGLVSWQLYQRDFCVAGVEEYRRVAAAGFAATLAAIAIAYAIVLPLSRGFLVLALVFTTLGLCISRFAVRRLIYQLARRGHRLDRVLIVGASQQGLALAVRLQASPSASTEVVGFLDEYRPVGYRLGTAFRVLGEPLDLWRIARQCKVTRAILVRSAMTWESLQALIPRMHAQTRLKVMLAPDLHDLNMQLEMRQLGPVLLTVPRSRPIAAFRAMQKRALDLAIATSVLALSVPILALACGWRWLRSGHWPLASRQVVGRGGRPFSLLEIGGSERLRRAHLARLPSLLSVLSGKLSIVGPRPLSVDELAAYKEWAELLLSVRPGFIGPWWEGLPLAPAEEVQLDVRYLQTYSAWSDFQVLWHAAARLVRDRDAEAMIARA